MVTNGHCGLASIKLIFIIIKNKVTHPVKVLTMFENLRWAQQIYFGALIQQKYVYFFVDMNL